MKEKIKKFPIVKQLLVIRRNHRMSKEFAKDKKIFLKKYVYSNGNSINKISYDMIRIVHMIEKGVSNKNPRPFGIKPTNNLMDLIKSYDKLSDKPNFEYNMSLTCLSNYLLFFEKKNWTEESQYKIVKTFMSQYKEYNCVDVGSRDFPKELLLKGMDFDYDNFLSTRHSVRSFSNKKVSDKDILNCVEMALKTPSACNRQMIKVYNCTSKSSVDYITKMAQGVGGFELKNISYLVITFDVNSFYFIGERNQGWFNSGLFSMNLVNAMHSKGIGSCFIQFGNLVKEEEEIKRNLNIPDNERIAVFIAYGYYDEISKVPYSTRKDVEEIYRER